jgi:acetyl-CoA carboxylase beta subunit
MSWQKEIDELRRREALAKKMGGDEKVARHHNQGKLTVRERIDALVDPGSFHEIGTATGVGAYDEAGVLKDFSPANFVLGRARIDGRRVVIAGDDFTVRGGANDAGILEKALASERMARDLRLPIVRLVDGTGGGGSVKNIETKGHTLLPGYDGRKWVYMLENLATVPVVSLALGSTAGLGAARVAASHYSVIVKETAQMFVAGPPVVARIGQKLEKNELGGSQIHTRIGAIDDEAEHVSPPVVRKQSCRVAARLVRRADAGLLTARSPEPEGADKVPGQRQDRGHRAIDVIDQDRVSTAPEPGRIPVLSRPGPLPAKTSDPVAIGRVKMQGVFLTIDHQHSAVRKASRADDDREELGGIVDPRAEHQRRRGIDHPLGKIGVVGAATGRAAPGGERHQGSQERGLAHQPAPVPSSMGHGPLH